jgi:hypothetical protein
MLGYQALQFSQGQLAFAGQAGQLLASGRQADVRIHARGGIL